jgi:hypothetical protein
VRHGDGEPHGEQGTTAIACTRRPPRTIA